MAMNEPHDAAARYKFLRQRSHFRRGVSKAQEPVRRQSIGAKLGVRWRLRSAGAFSITIEPIARVGSGVMSWQPGSTAAYTRSSDWFR